VEANSLEMSQSGGGDEVEVLTDSAKPREGEQDGSSKDAIALRIEKRPIVLLGLRLEGQHAGLT